MHVHETPQKWSLWLLQSFAITQEKAARCSGESGVQEPSCLLAGINCHQPFWVMQSYDRKEGGWSAGFGEGEPHRLGVTAIQHTLQSVEGRKITGRNLEDDEETWATERAQLCEVTIPRAAQRPGLVGRPQRGAARDRVTLIISCAVRMHRGARIRGAGCCSLLPHLGAQEHWPWLLTGQFPSSSLSPNVPAAHASQLYWH